MLGVPDLNCEEDPEVSLADQLACEIVVHVEQDKMTVEELHQKLHLRPFENDDGVPSTWDDDLTPEIVDEVMLPSERKDFMDRSAEHRQHKQISKIR